MSIYKLLDRRLEEIILVITMVVMVVLIFYQVLSRYVLSNSLSWTEEMARYVHVWQVWIGASFAVRMDKHIKVEMVKDLLPPMYRRIVELIALLLWFFLAVVLAYIGTVVVLDMIGSGQTSPAMRIPMWIGYAAVPVGGILMSLRLVQQIVKHFKKPAEEAS
ncbi:TRAP-type C4-dicarboxylate transport system permease small subunit [Salsuginibacillus halophilus]|uniref:TRAP-type C4-dicarboxylate transport system permease small subunit n=1 Tax=Salsuginibacillus halophilus TaxID=517424 RepID=A0A2P8HLD5_9BACI|nr:TRAP transporter small permease [Salsuginibacillus halophilus]PSL46990.1 TRAP-type C4-dicarboxylate transport system permease small subunit [Salsuginibacillus halophilus]